MPSTASLLLTLLISSLGSGYLLYGRRNAHPVASLCGVLLMAVPLLVSGMIPLLLIAGLLLAVPFLARG
jgi:hypothetical protein